LNDTLSNPLEVLTLEVIWLDIRCDIGHTIGKNMPASAENPTLNALSNVLVNAGLTDAPGCRVSGEVCPVFQTRVVPRMMDIPGIRSDPGS